MSLTRPSMQHSKCKKKYRDEKDKNQEMQYTCPTEPDMIEKNSKGSIEKLSGLDLTINGISSTDKIVIELPKSSANISPISDFDGDFENSQVYQNKRKIIDIFIKDKK